MSTLTQFENELRNITENGEGIGHFTYKIRIVAGEESFAPLRINTLSIKRDFEVSYSEELYLSMFVTPSQYAHLVVPNRDQLFVEITSSPIFETSDQQRSDEATRFTVYRAQVMNQTNPAFIDNQAVSVDDKALDQQGLIGLELQLINEGLYLSRFITVGSIYRNANPMDVLIAELTRLKDSLKLEDDVAIKGVTKAPGYSTEERRVIIIPHGTPIFNVPYLLQEEEGGVYSTGLGYFLQGGFWYLYPLYDTTRATGPCRTLTVVQYPPTFGSTNRTYISRDDNITIIAAGATNVDDPGFFDQLNNGNAVRFADVRKLLEFEGTDSNRTTIKRNENIFEFKGPEFQDGLTNARWADERSTSNPFVHYTEMARRNGRYVTVQWKYGDINLLKPGMPVKFMNTANQRIVTYFGVLLGAQEERIPSQSGPVPFRFQSIITLKIFLSRIEDKEVLTA